MPIWAGSRKRSVKPAGIFNVRGQWILSPSASKPAHGIDWRLNVPGAAWHPLYRPIQFVPQERMQLFVPVHWVAFPCLIAARRKPRRVHRSKAPLLRLPTSKSTQRRSSVSSTMPSRAARFPAFQPTATCANSTFQRTPLPPPAAFGHMATPCSFSAFLGWR